MNWIAYIFLVVGLSTVFAAHSNHGSWYRSWTLSPTCSPSHRHTRLPTSQYTSALSTTPSLAPSAALASSTNRPSHQSSDIPSLFPTVKSPTHFPTFAPTTNPTFIPTFVPSYRPSLAPTRVPTGVPTFQPVLVQSNFPVICPTTFPTTLQPMLPPSYAPSNVPTVLPSIAETLQPTSVSSPSAPLQSPTMVPTLASTALFTTLPTLISTDVSTQQHTQLATAKASSPSIKPPTANPTYSERSTCFVQQSDLGDGWCDKAANTAGCEYDRGDCCIETCSDISPFSCGVNGFTCIDPNYSTTYLNKITREEINFMVGNISEAELLTRDIWKALIYLSVDSILQTYDNVFQWHMQYPASVSTTSLIMAVDSRIHTANIVLNVIQIKETASNQSVSSILEESVQKGLLQRSLRKFAQELDLAPYEYIVICEPGNLEACQVVLNPVDQSKTSSAKGTRDSSAIYIICGCVIGFMICSGALLYGRNRLLKKKKSETSFLSSPQVTDYEKVIQIAPSPAQCASDRIFRDPEMQSRPDWVNQWNDPRGQQDPDLPQPVGRNLAWLNNSSDISLSDINSETTTDIWTSGQL